MPGQAIAPHIRGGTNITVDPTGLLDTAGGVGDLTGLTGSLGIVVTNGAGPVPDVAFPLGTEVGQWLTWTGAAFAPSSFGKALQNAGNELAIVNDGTATTGIRITTVAASGGAGGSVVVDSASLVAVGSSSTPLVGVQTSVGGEVNLVSSTWRWFDGGVQPTRVDTLSGTGANSQVWAAKVDSVAESFTQRDEDTLAAIRSWANQVPSAGATGVNRDSGNMQVTINPPTTGGRFGARITRYDSGTADYDEERFGRISVTNAGPHDLTEAQSDALPGTCTCTVTCMIKVRDTAGATRATITIQALWAREAAGAPAQTGTDQTLSSIIAAGAAGIAITIVASGNTLLPRLTGVAGVTFSGDVEVVYSVDS